MSEASKRTAQQQRIQQLQERLELYNAAATRSELPSTASATASTGRAAKPTRAPPPINSPNANAADTAQPVLSPLFSTGGVPVSAAAPTTTGPAATREEPIRVSSAPQTRTYETPPAPAPAPRLARNLAEDFVSSAASSPVGAPAVSSTRTSPFTAASPPPPRPATTTTTTTTTSASAAPAATSPLHASQVFGYYTESDEDDDGDDEGEYVEYEVEEVEEYQEDEEDDDYTEEEEEEEENIHDGSQPTLDNVLRRIFKAYSGSPDRASSNPQAERAASSSQEYVPEFLASSKARVGTAGAAASASSTHPLIQRAAELYRQHRLHQAQQHHHSPFHTSEDDAARAHPTAAGRGALDGSSVSTSEPTAELEDDGSGSETTATSTSSDSYLSPAAAYAALNLGGATSLVSRAASAAAAAAAAGVAEKSASPSSTTAGVASSLPIDSSTFNQLETAYRQLLLVQRGVEYAVQRTGIQHFPDPLPHQEKAQTLAQERNALVQKDMEMRAAAPEGPSLVDVRAHEAAALEAAIDAIYVKFAAAMQAVQPVVDRSATVEDKMRLLKQREMELAQQREARIIVEREVVKQESLLGERKERMRRREAEYNAQLQQHDEQQKTAQQHIGEVEQLSKQVSSWLAILEERDRRLAQKEKRLQHVQADLLRRNEDVLVWKKATQRVKQIPPPPSPPRIR